MKVPTNITIMKTTIIASATLFLLTLSTTAFAQKSSTWKGGTPGQENNWNCSKNWSTNAVPDDFSNVIIPDVSSATQAMPVIKSGSVEINAISITSNAMLTIEKDAQLIVFEQAEGIEANNLQLKGSLVLPNSRKATTQNILMLQEQTIQKKSADTTITAKL